MHDHYGSRALRQRRREPRKINLPALVVNERVRHGANVSKIGQIFKEGIARRRHQDFISYFAEQAKDVVIGLACAGGNDNAFRVNTCLSPEKSRPPAVIVRYRFTSLGQTLALGLITQHAAIIQGGKKLLFRIAEAAGRRVGIRQVKQWLAAAPMLFESSCEAIRFQTPICSRRKHAFAKRSRISISWPHGTRG